MTWLREPDTEPIPGYRLIEPLGTGGFGEVWKCVAPGGIFKAIKFVYGNLNTLDDDSAKAEQEFKAIDRVKAVRHPFVLSMDRIEVVSGELLIVMELADKSLHDLLQEYQQAGRSGIPRDILLGLLADAAEGLDHLIEKHNLQHLDVKPKNLFLIADRVKVADFGLVKHLERQSFSGIMGGITPVYAAPETFANKISKHSDQYSLAVVYVELLTGLRPFSGKNIRQLALQHLTELPDLSILPEQDRAAVARAMAKEPEERFPTCLAFLRALGGAKGRSDVTLGDVSIDTPPPLSSRRVGGSAGIGTPTVPDMPPPPTRLPPQKTTPSPSSSAIRLSQHDLHLSGEPSGRHSPTASVTFRPEEGVLRPAILIGVGSFGRRALQQIRCRLLDRVGDLSQVPCFRFLYVDADPETTAKAMTGPADAALQAEHTFHAPLQPVTAYRRRQLDQIQEWLPREKLYAIPRSLRVDGSRALGRLAFTDHYLRFTTRLRQELQICTHPEAMSQSADTSGLMVK
ncbi:MAG: protein kinase, partial [Bacteroidales bacterium]|nr:protein kinase [Bacteroidales bacterium]